MALNLEAETLLGRLWTGVGTYGLEVSDKTNGHVGRHLTLCPRFAEGSHVVPNARLHDSSETVRTIGLRHC